MSNTSTNIYSVSPDIFYCVKEPYVGLFWSSVLMSLCFLLGIPAHSWILWNILHGARQIKPTQMLPLSLTTMDLFFCIHTSVEILNLYILQNNTIGWVLLFVFGLFWINRLLIQVCICIEQYMAVIHPVTFLRYKGIQYRIASAAIACLFSSLYGFLLVTKVVTFPDLLFSFICFIGVIVISFCCASILYVLKHPGPGGREVKTERNVGNQQKKNAFHNVSTVLLNVLLSYIPMASIYVLSFTKIDMFLLNCEIIPILISPNICCVFCPPLLKLYKNGPQKCKEIK